MVKVKRERERENKPGALWAFGGGFGVGGGRSETKHGNALLYATPNRGRSLSLALPLVPCICVLVWSLTASTQGGPGGRGKKSMCPGIPRRRTFFHAWRWFWNGFGLVWLGRDGLDWVEVAFSSVRTRGEAKGGGGRGGGMTRAGERSVVSYGGRGRRCLEGCGEAAFEVVAASPEGPASVECVGFGAMQDPDTLEFPL